LSNEGIQSAHRQCMPRCPPREAGTSGSCRRSALLCRSRGQSVRRKTKGSCVLASRGRPTERLSGPLVRGQRAASSPPTSPVFWTGVAHGARGRGVREVRVSPYNFLRRSCMRAASRRSASAASRPTASRERESARQHVGWAVRALVRSTSNGTPRPVWRQSAACTQACGPAAREHGRNRGSAGRPQAQPTLREHVGRGSNGGIPWSRTRRKSPPEGVEGGSRSRWDTALMTRGSGPPDHLWRSISRDSRNRHSMSARCLALLRRARIWRSISWMTPRASSSCPAAIHWTVAFRISASSMKG
jgi:hypothetical protein